LRAAAITPDSANAMVAATSSTVRKVVIQGEAMSGSMGRLCARGWRRQTWPEATVSAVSSHGVDHDCYKIYSDRCK
jgi:hypothetical protein